jgi:hypothetical protein
MDAPNPLIDYGRVTQQHVAFRSRADLASYHGQIAGQRMMSGGRLGRTHVT